MKWRVLTTLVMPMVFAAATPARANELLSEGFDDVTTLAASGWVITNQSMPLGQISWFQGGDYAFPAQSGASTAYIASNFVAAELGGTISNWLITPEFSTEAAGVVSFWIRGDVADGFEDQVAYGFSTGSATTSAFAMSAAQIVPQGDWNQVSIAFLAAGAGTTGRFAIEHVGPADTSNYIGIDTFSITTATAAVPEPATWGMMVIGFGLAGGAMRTSRRRQKAAVQSN